MSYKESHAWTVNSTLAFSNRFLDFDFISFIFFYNCDVEFISSLCIASHLNTESRAHCAKIRWNAQFSVKYFVSVFVCDSLKKKLVSWVQSTNYKFFLLVDCFSDCESDFVWVSVHKFSILRRRFRPNISFLVACAAYISICMY